MMRGRKNISRPQKFDYVQHDGARGAELPEEGRKKSVGLSLSKPFRKEEVVGTNSSTRSTKDAFSAVSARSASQSLEDNKSLKPFRRQKGKATTLSSTNYWSDASSARQDYSETETATSLANLREKCKLLVNYAHIDRMKLEKDYPEIYKDFINIVFLGQAIISKPEAYNEYMRVIGEVFENVDITERNTVGDFMYGCYKKQSVTGRIGCTPECAGGLPRHTSKSEDICDHHVGIYKNKLSLNFSPTVASSNLLDIHAYKNKIKLTHEALEDLSDRGIEHFKIYWHTANPGVTLDKEDVQTYNVKKMQSNIGKGGHISYHSDGSERFHRSSPKLLAKNKKEKNDLNKECEYGWIIGIVIFFFFIFIVIFGFWYCFSNRTNAIGVAVTLDTGPKKVCSAPVIPRKENDSKYNKCS